MSRFASAIPNRINVSSTGGNSTFIPKLAKCCLPLTIESRGSGSVNGEYNRRIYRKSGLRVPAPSHTLISLSLGVLFFPPFFSSPLLIFLLSSVFSPFFYFIVRIVVEQRTLLTEKEGHEPPCNSRGREKLTQLQKSQVEPD